MKRTQEQYEEEVNKLTKGEYSVVGKYINVDTKVLMRHNCETCNNHEWEIKPNNFFNGQRCPKCQHRSYKKTTEEFKKEVYSLIEDEYSVLEEYKNTKTKILFKHNKCGNEFKMMPAHFLRGVRCPFCNESKGEQKIRYYLERNNINFSPQYIFDECKRKEVLPFDFAIFEDKEKSKLKFLIEYDGDFHYKPIMGKRKLKYQQENDNIKNEYCKTCNIKLIRIPYWEYDNIENILNKELKL